MPNPFKKVFHGKDKKKSSSKKKSSQVDSKNRIFSQPKHAAPRPPSQAFPAQGPPPPNEGEEQRHKIIGEAYMTPVSPAGNYPARNPYGQEPVVPTSSLPYQPQRPSKLRQARNANSDSDTGSESEGEKRKNNRSDLLRDARPDTSLDEGLGFFLLRNHTMTSMCFGYNLNRLDGLGKAALFLFVFLATLYTALLTVTYPNQSSGTQVGISVLVIPAATWGLKSILMAFRNARATGWIAFISTLFIDLVLFILTMWQTWTLITDFSAELWTVLILWIENYVLNQVLEVPGLLIQYFFARKCCPCCVPKDIDLV